MDSLRDFFKRIKDRPAIYLLMLAGALAFSAAEAYNPIIRKYGSFSYVFKHNYMKTLSGWMGKAGDFFHSGASAYLYIMIALMSIFVISLLIAILLSGYSNVLLSAVNGKEKRKGEFAAGIKKSILKITLFLFCLIVLTVVFYFLVIYSVIPAVSMLMMFFDGNTGVMFTMLVLSILSVAVVLLAIIFYGMYFSYILPSITEFRKGGFKAGISMTNTYCWYLLPKTLLFLFLAALIRTVLFVIHYGHQSVVLSIVVLLITAVLRSFLYYIYIYFVFNTFVAMRDDLYPDYVDEMDAAVQNAQVPGASKAPERLPRRNTVKADVEKEDPAGTRRNTNAKHNDDYDDSFEP